MYFLLDCRCFTRTIKGNIRVILEYYISPYSSLYKQLECYWSEQMIMVKWIYKWGLLLYYSNKARIQYSTTHTIPQPVQLVLTQKVTVNKKIKKGNTCTCMKGGQWKNSELNDLHPHFFKRSTDHYCHFF